MEKQRAVPVPEWIDKPPSQWPASARTAMGILATWAERELQEQKAAQLAQGDGRAA